MTQAQTSVVRQQIVVEAPLDKAFGTFTERFGDVKPKEHDLLTDHRDGLRAARGRAHLRPRRGRQRMPVGTRARVRAAEPGGVQLGHRPDTATGDPPGERQRGGDPVRGRDTERTRLELEHRYIDRHGPGWEAVAGGVGSDGGWPLYLRRYAALLD
ncbi:ATPase [Prauserella alba]|uniref:ATPase n=1 Tax=Prauserella alba TaxID=176898 RepID=UPI0020A53C88|nr:ATPase [Prauserella alba]MCP2179521.1 hypothetical protein [Prauserella alba]